MSSRAVLSLYRQLLRQCHRLPEGQASPSLREVVDTFRKHRGADPSDVQRLLERGNSRLSFLNMVTPRRRSGSGGSTTYVLRNGRLVEVQPEEVAPLPDKAISNWTGKNVDPENISRHRNLVARQRRLGLF
eukprot:TRINITY_DN21980_c0_g1_i1.p1 TRINITY_DN21980_c0_g1~~TRINITY_DN21980_c0_g1_i1.p1  ORF type:complete len:146 (+),score=28.44 TRINITY_DN21980_c0_g1_i1:48-440(+)